MITVTRSAKKFKKVVCVTILSGITTISMLGCSGGSGVVTNALSTYNYNMTIAEDSLKVLLFHDSESYKSIKKELKSKLSSDIYNNYFKSEDYDGYDLTKPSIKINSVKGDMSREDKIIFKIDITFSSGDTTVDATMLVTVQDGIVTYIERI